MKRRIYIGHLIKSHEWFEEKVKNYHGNIVEIISEYNGSEKPVDIIYHCDLHGSTYATLNAKNICKSYFLPCKKCQSINKSKAGKNKEKVNKKPYYDRLVEYCKSRGGYVLEKEWTKAKDYYNFKCNDPSHPTFTTTADSLLSNKSWCPYCSGRSGDFKSEIKDICRSNNGELLSDYKSSETYVTVKCNIHNYIWDILPNNIKRGRWCPVCSMGFNEKVVWDYFIDLCCNIKIQYSFDDLIGKNNELLKFDFAIFNDLDSLIHLVEVDDEEHRNKNFANTPRQLQRRAAIERDKVKNEYCAKNNIPLYRMEVPFRGENKWAYDDYYRYINTELKSIVNLARVKGGETC